eukprot:9488020-Pyramimonas_sp.AAC.1
MASALVPRAWSTSRPKQCFVVNAASTAPSASSSSTFAKGLRRQPANSSSVVTTRWKQLGEKKIFRRQEDFAEAGGGNVRAAGLVVGAEALLLREHLP